MTSPSRRTALRLGGASLAALSLSGCLGARLSAMAGAAPEIEWVQTYDHRHRDDGRTLVETADGGFALAGEAATFATDKTTESNDVWVARTNADGTERWSETYGGTDFEEGSAIVHANDGGRGGDSDADDSGADDSDGFVVGGWSSSNGVTANFWLAHLDSQGATTWTRTYDNGGNEYLSSVAATSDGGYVLAGTTTAPEGGAGWLVKVAASGETEWSRTYATSDGGGLSDVFQTDDGGFVLAGHASTGSESGYSWFRKTDAEGDVEWRTTYRKDGKSASANDVAPTADGGLLVVGTTSSMGFGSDPDWVLKFDANGERAWTQTYEKLLDPHVVSEPGGGAVVAGRRDGNLVLAGVDASGAKQWQKPYSKAKMYVPDALVRTEGDGYAVLGRRHVGSLGDYGLTDAVLVKLA